MAGSEHRPKDWFSPHRMAFFIWNHSITNLEKFICHLNMVHPTITLTKYASTNAATHLDLDIYNKDHTKTHFKSTNTSAYLRCKSNHPKSTFKEVHKGENIRMLRNTSEEVEYQQTMTFLNNQFKPRKYPPYLTNSPIISHAC